MEATLEPRTVRELELMGQVRRSEMEHAELKVTFFRRRLDHAYKEIAELRNALAAAQPSSH